MYKSIVVGTDGSERAAIAVLQAAELAKVCGAKLHVVSAYKGVETAVASAMAAGASRTRWRTTPNAPFLSFRRIREIGNLR